MSLATASVLAVDDNATIRRAIAMRLGSKGYHVVTAENGGSALAALDEHEFDLMLLDLQMPGMRGDEVLRRVRNRYNETELPVIMLAASDDKNDIAKTLELGANDYVIKPGDLPILLARIKTQLSLRSTARQLHAQEQTFNKALHESANSALMTSSRPGITAASFEGTWSFQPTNPLERRFNVLYDNTPMTCFTLNRSLEVLFANRFGVQFLGYTAGDLRSRSVLEFYAETDRNLADEYLLGVLSQPNRVHRWEIRRLKKNGDVLWMRETARVLGDGPDAVILMTCEDIDDTYKLAEKLAYHSAHDDLTGLANRKVLEERLGRVIDSAHSEHSQHTLAIVDIDQFKIINDTCGYAAGDELLKHTARILSSAVRKRDTVARVGGDEFGVLFEDCTLDQAARTVETAREALASFHFEWQATAHRISASVGLVAIDRRCDGVTAALSMADTACYAAKDAGRNRSHIYHADDDRVVAKHGQMRWATRINDALRDDRFELSMQPITPIADTENDGDHYELLIRMRDEQGNLVLPGEFLPAAERYSLANKIDHWVIEHALQWLSDHPHIFERLYLCGINLSGQSFGDERVLNFILKQLDLHSPRLAGKLCFEVTETAAVADIVQAKRFIGALKERGCQFALDDFGSGFSSFTYLKNLPVDFLKIDGSFVREIANDSIDLEMVRSINEIGHVMGKKTIAEFVEDQAILGVLRTLGVDYAQGYEIGRPHPIKEFMRCQPDLLIPAAARAGMRA
jgi:diguanylate cyclase (GGDEF)-like protein/PAS domain S-box-containing protein